MTIALSIGFPIPSQPDPENASVAGTAQSSPLFDFPQGAEFSFMAMLLELTAPDASVGALPANDQEKTKGPKDSLGFPFIGATVSSIDAAALCSASENGAAAQQGPKLAVSAFAAPVGPASEAVASTAPGLAGKESVRVQEGVFNTAAGDTAVDAPANAAQVHGATLPTDGVDPAPLNARLNDTNKSDVDLANRLSRPESAPTADLQRTEDAASMAMDRDWSRARQVVGAARVQSASALDDSSRGPNGQAVDVLSVGGSIPLKESTVRIVDISMSRQEAPQSHSTGAEGTTAVLGLHVAAAPGTVNHVEASRPVSLTEQVHVHFSEHLQQLREAGRVDFQMTLHPPELGRMQLHVALNEGRLNVHFLVQNDGAKSALDHQLEPMRVRFAEMGFSLGQFDVRRDGNSSTWQAFADARAGDDAGTYRQTVGSAGRTMFVGIVTSDSQIDVMA